MSDSVFDLLERYWGYTSLRPGQEPLIRAILDGTDVLGILPTGTGKSLCYQLPALSVGGLTVVISPLVALMEDQVRGLGERGIAATHLSANLSHRMREDRWNAVLAGHCRLLYVAPERLFGERFRARIAQVQVARLIVDEAHCVSAWGHDFRPAYRKIPEARAWMGDPPMAAFTATATPPVRRDIVRALELRDPQVQVAGFDRPEITWSVFNGVDKARKLADVLDGVPGAGVVYASTRAGVDRWAGRLREAGVSVSRYHAGMPSVERTSEQGTWTQGRSRVMVATNAFGMGIDRPDVRFVAHVDLPASLDAYYQEAGRAGRDRAPAHAVLLVGADDARALRTRIDAWHPEAADARGVYEVACSMAGIAVGSESDAPFSVDVDRVGQVLSIPVGRVHRTLELLVQQGALIGHLPAPGLARVRLSADPTTTLERLGPGASGALRDFTETVIRQIAGEADGVWGSVRIARLARSSGLRESRVAAGLQFLAERRVLEAQLPEEAWTWSLPGERPARPPVDASAIREGRKRAERLADDMIQYTEGVGCRRHGLLAYFGQASPARCGNCDDCLGRHKPLVATPDQEGAAREVLRSVRDGRSLDALADRMPRYQFDALVDALIAEGLLARADPFSPPTITPEGLQRLG